MYLNSSNWGAPAAFTNCTLSLLILVMLLVVFTIHVWVQWTEVFYVLPVG